jgi:hypothetical protein
VWPSGQGFEPHPIPSLWVAITLCASWQGERCSCKPLRVRGVCVIVVAQVRNTLSSFSLRANCTPTLLDNTSAASSTMQRCYEKMIRCCAASEKSMATLLTICVTQRMHRPQLASPRSVTLHAAGLHLKSSNNIEPLIVTHHKRKSITRPARRQVWPLHRVSLRR